MNALSNWPRNRLLLALPSRNLVGDLDGGAAQRRHPSRAECAGEIVLSSKVGEVVNIAQTRLVNRHRLSPSRTLYFPRRRRGFQRERTQHACPPIGPHGRPGTMPRMRRGDFDQTDRAYGRTRPRTPHVRMQRMPRAASIHRLSRKQHYPCDGTLAGQSPARRAFEPPGGRPWHLTRRGFSLRAASLRGELAVEG
jgi:hypothetical protein